MATKGKINVAEYAKKISGPEFLVLDNLLHVWIPTKEISDKLSRGKGMQAQFAEAFHYLSEANLIETDWNKLERKESWNSIYRLARITPEGTEVLNIVLQDPTLKVRVLLLALSARGEQAVEEGAEDVLTKLYQKVKLSDSLFLPVQRDKTPK